MKEKFQTVILTLGLLAVMFIVPIICIILCTSCSPQKYDAYGRPLKGMTMHGGHISHYTIRY